MLMQEHDYCSVKQEEEFSTPVEFIMRCEDFKSNFARRLSNRYISRSPTSSPKQESSLKLRPLEPSQPAAIPDNTLGRIKTGFPLSKSEKLELNSNVVKPQAKPFSINTSAQHAEVSALHMEVETLKWQLAQTETNRQMHIALLNQIVTFLNRVKDHLECQKADSESVQDIAKRRPLPRSLNLPGLPRSRSVLHVNKQLEYSFGSAKRIGTRQISKSISYVNGFKVCSGVWNQSRICLTSEANSEKITEEMSSLITLANTILSTKLPDLAYAYDDVQNMSNAAKDSAGINQKESQSSTHSINLIDEDMTTSAVVIQPICDSSDLYEDLPSSIVDVADASLKKAMPISTLICDLDNDFTEMKLNDKDQKSPVCKNEKNDKPLKVLLNNTRLDCNHINNNFIEDESGFSSMSSFQEIGIPIKSKIPPSPCKELEYIDDISEIMEEREKWNNEIELNKQTVKVFWV